MMLALMLAQLVLPWPGLDSPLVQPPGMICLGACAGPVIYGAAERAHLVVACDMRSDTCSDGRKITTTRSTPVPCEVSPGVWEMVPEDTGCYSVRGLESWAATTSYLAYGAELGLNPPWVPNFGASVAAVESFWRVCGETPSSQLQNLTSGEDGVPVTASCIVRAATSGRMGIQATHVSLGGNVVDYNLTSEWQTVSATTTLSGGTAAFARILPSRSGPGCIDAIGCWLTRTDTPGRACWGGEAPVTCDGDRHIVSTEGWPTTEGEISFTYVNMEGTWGEERIFIADGQRFQIKTVIGGKMRVILNGVGTTLPGNPAWRPVDQVQHIRAVLSAGSLEVFVNGVSVGSVETGPIEYSGTARIGSTTATWANGSIRSLTVRSYEEVPP